MSTKSVIQSLINTKLADASDILASELREVEDIFLTELFPSTTNVVLATGDLQYNINFTKSGNFCTMQGFVKNNSASIINGVNIYTVSNTIYQAKHIQQFSGIRQGTSNVINFRLGTTVSTFPNQLLLQTALASNATVNFSLTYIVND